jgi:ribosome maturation factor RimP
MLLCGSRKTAAGDGVLALRPPDNIVGSGAILSALAHLEPIITPAVEAAGYRLVRLRLLGGKRKTLQVMAERPDGGMDIEDCARLSRELSDFLEREDPIDGEFVLEVSSPGIDRPLTRLTDFARWAGHDAKIELKAPDAEGRKRFMGQLLGLDDSSVVIEMSGARRTFPFSSIAEAKLVLTDRLIQEDLRARKPNA